MHAASNLLQVYKLLVTSGIQSAMTLWYLRALSGFRTIIKKRLSLEIVLRVIIFKFQENTIRKRLKYTVDYVASQ